MRGDVMNIGDRLYQMRQNKEISVYKLALDSEVSENHIRNLERGTKHASVETLEKLVKSLGISMSEFFSEESSISYLTPREKIMLDHYRNLPDNTATAIAELCEKLSNHNPST